MEREEGSILRLGLARLGLGLRVIYTCHKDKLDKLAFDTRQYNHILWETPETCVLV